MQHDKNFLPYTKKTVFGKKSLLGAKKSLVKMYRIKIFYFMIVFRGWVKFFYSIQTNKKHGGKSKKTCLR